MERLNATFHADTGGARQGDLVWRTPRRDGGDAHAMLLLGFQSKPDRLMALRMLVHAGLPWQQLEKEKRPLPDGRLPPNTPDINPFSTFPSYHARMDLTVCICTHSRPRYVRDCLQGLRRQTLPRDSFAIILVDSASAPPAAAELAELAAANDARFIRLDQPGVSLARNAGAWAARTPFIAYIDDDAIPAPDWIESILNALRPSATTKPARRPALIGGRILPKWEAPLPDWWPPSLRGVLSIIEYEGHGEYRTDAVPASLEPYAANMVVHVLSLLAAGGFGGAIGRYGNSLLSDEEVQLAWTLQDAGYSVRYDSRITVHHQIQAARLDPAWLLSRLYWQGASTVLTRRLLHQPQSVWKELPRRLLVAALLAPAWLVPRHSTVLLAARWRLAYATGFIRTALGWRATSAAIARNAMPVAA